MIRGDTCRIRPDLNTFQVYRIGNTNVQVFYYRQPNTPPRILDLPKCLVEVIPNEYEPTVKEIRTRILVHARKRERGHTFDMVRKELISEYDGGGRGGLE